ncbi:2-C-methyl-D-erythritol 4-phosphate cytidylyltransferase [Pedobacter nutrimenti]|jgi:2-C-methyl-D-erythritol 4-phosphate cytidylyltransferase|uniref:2-C-methyl-D-erythritol 4-phosphate cytidylyltransferase n=1 Tax=Pedobacter nutrimenti TaxID=1241337 RepID=A0A318UBI1_9SPHI|nr:2-C-methyl-D-erythritol 4-phosphate cytidylyltransferase [Pedobacter nutrimenti]PYF72893.1 2-C-methyl-D-erythritol 4-phosphate cytidylyltransferase [Pedobacter nutrimenti]
MKYYAIIVAGGSGNRMKAALAKQFLLLQDLPILMHTLRAFHHCSLQPEILLVLNIHQHQYWEDLCVKYHFDVPHQIIKGGEQRFHSVKNGLKNIKGKGIIAVHDAVRPMVSPALIEAAFHAAEENGNAIAAIHPTDSIRIQTTGTHNEALNRDQVFLIQTPQAFHSDQLKNAYKLPYRNEYTDDASVVERAGYPIHLIEGERENIKITYPLDLEIISLLMHKKSS